MKVVIYARYSTDLQNPSSIKDQIAICEDYARKNNYEVVDIFTDAAVSGATLHRAGIQQLLNSHGFDAVLCEALDRLSRDLADTATIHRNLSFQGKDIITLDDGLVNDLHVGMKGMLSTIFLKQLAQKTHRGLRGKINEGKSAGGICYGYSAISDYQNGKLIKGEREINEEQAKIVRHIFIEYGNNDKSARTIAAELNRQGITFNGKTWNDTTISGNRRRGTGILNNEMYIGRLIWNKLKYSKNPQTGKRISRLNPESEWVINEREDLRIIDKDLWDTVKHKQTLLDATTNNDKRRKRATYMLSGVIKCSVCGGGVAMHNAVQYGCSRKRNTGLCNNNAKVRRDKLEQAILSVITKELLQDEIVKVFVDEYNKHYQRLIKESQAAQPNYKAQVIKLENQKNNLVESIKKGVPAELIKDELVSITDKLNSFKQRIEPPKYKEIRHHGITERFKDAVNNLHSDNLDHDAMVQLRKLINSIDLHSNGQVDVIIDYSGLLDKKIHADEGVYLNVVAGAGFEPTTFGL